jgi:hypothetical protein
MMIRLQLTLVKTIITNFIKLKIEFKTTTITIIKAILNLMRLAA